MTVSLHQLLKTMVEKGGTDLHVTTNSPPLIRVDGTLVTLSHPPMSAVDTKKLAYSVLTDAQKHRFEESLELDISFGVKGLARFRANIYMQRGAVAGAFRRAGEYRYPLPRKYRATAARLTSIAPAARLLESGTPGV